MRQRYTLVSSTPDPDVTDHPSCPYSNSGLPVSNDSMLSGLAPGCVATTAYSLSALPGC
jgi:hypothetical protein